MTREENIATVRRWFEALGRGELGIELYAPDVRIDNVQGFPITGPYHGLDGVRRWFDDLHEVIENPRWEMEEIAALDEERVLTVQRWQGRFAHTGIAVDEVWASIITLRDGLVVRAQGFASKKQALRNRQSPI